MGEEDSAMRTVKSADRVLDVFELFARRSREMSHAQIAEQLGIPKSSLSQLLATLVARDYLEVSADKRNYRLGNSLLALSRRKAASQDLTALSRPVLKALTAACGESSALNLLADDEAVVAYAEMAPQRLVSHMREGDRAPLYATSSGKIFLADMSEEALAAYLKRVQLRKITPNTLVNKSQLREQLADIRKAGIAYSYEEFTVGIVGIGKPIVDAQGVVIGAINVAIPAARFQPAHRSAVVLHLERSAKALNEQLADLP